MQRRRRALLRAAGRVPGGSVPFIGTATVVLRVGPFTLLTGPNFLRKGEPAHLGYGIHCGGPIRPWAWSNCRRWTRYCCRTATATISTRWPSASSTSCCPSSARRTFKSSLEDFLAAARAAGLQDKVQALRPGERFNFTVPAERWR